MTMVYRIRKFSDYYETAESRKLQRLTWIAMPTKQEGDGYTELMSGHENGCAHFGAWTAMLQLAAKCSPRGTLLRNLGGRLVAHDLASISRITRVPVEVLREAMPRLLGMGWMEEIAIDEVTENLLESPGEPGDGRKKPGSTGQDRGGTGQDKTGEGGGDDTPPPPPASPCQITAPEGSPQTPEARRQKRRLDLLVILKAANVKLTMGEDNIFQEWIDETDGFYLEWIETVLKEARPRIKLPSALRIELKRRADGYQEWKQARQQRQEVAV